MTNANLCDYCGISIKPFKGIDLCFDCLWLKYEATTDSPILSGFNNYIYNIYKGDTKLVTKIIDTVNTPLIVESEDLLIPKPKHGIII